MRLEWLAAYRRLHAQLTDRYPNDKPRVERYFRSPAAPKVTQAKRQPEVVAVASSRAISGRRRCAKGARCRAGATGRLIDAALSAQIKRGEFGR